MSLSTRNLTVSARDLMTQDDTSLALSAAGGNTNLSGKTSANQKSIRVKEQVKVSLTRQATRNNGVFSQNKSVRGVDVTSVYSSKLNGYSSYSSSATGNVMRRTTRRVEVSPPSSPVLSSPSRLNRSVYHSKIQTSGLGQSRVAGNVKNFHRSISQPHNLKKAPNPTSAPIGRSISQTGGAQSRYSSRVNRQIVGMRNVRQTVVKPKIHRQEQHSNSVFSYSGENVPWLAQLRKDGQMPKLLKSYPASVASSTELPAEPTQTQISGLKKNPEMTVEQAIGFLTQNNEEKLHDATSFLQMFFIQGSEWKKKVFKPQWIEQFMRLLIHHNEGVLRVSAGILRVIVYQNNDYKMEVEKKDGLTIITNALKHNRDKETRRHLTGLLWNLSSHDKIKENFTEKTIDVLTRVILVPSSGIFRGENPKDDFAADAKAFYNATGCLRNLSSAGPNIRDQMRSCENLIDSIVCYVRSTAADRQYDDESTENCICILQNLAYGAKPEPELASESDSVSRQSVKPEKTSVGCFSSLTPKEPEEFLHKAPVLTENGNPVGIQWLWSPIMIRTYLSLMACSTRDGTREGAVGALQNITAGNNPESEAIADFIVHKEEGLRQIEGVLQKNVCEGTVANLIRNLSSHSIVQADIVKHVLINVVAMLPQNDTGEDQPSELTACLCQILINLTKGGKENAKAIIKTRALIKINNISRIHKGNTPSQAGRAACILLHHIWKYTDLHSYIKQMCGLKKRHFVNQEIHSVIESEKQKRKCSKS